MGSNTHTWRDAAQRFTLHNLGLCWLFALFASTRESFNNSKRASRASGHYQQKHNKHNTANHHLYLHKTPSRAYHYLRRTEVEEEPSRSPEQEMTVFDEHREIEQVLDCVKKVR